MACASSRTQLTFSLYLALVLALFPQTAYAHSSADLPPTDIPALTVFVEQVSNSQADVLRGVYIPGVLANMVVQQPEKVSAFVSSTENTLTQFGLADRYGSIGLLAHNFLVGKNFSQLEQGQVLYLIYGDGAIVTFIITSLMRVQAVEPDNVKSHFVELDTGATFTATELFTRVYAQPGKVILQTCITSHGNASWGRLFISAEPYKKFIL